MINNKKYWNEEFETLSRAEIEKYQLKELSDELEFAYANSPYYKEAFDKAGVKPSDLKELSDISKFPFTNKQIERERQAIKPILGDMAAVSEEEVVFISASSGSTGTPTVSPFTKQDFDEFQETESKLFWGMGMRPNDRYLHALNFSLFVGGPDVIGAQNLGALCIWAGTLPSERLLFIMQEFQPTVMWTTPSYAWYLGETAKNHGIDPAKDLAINKIIVAGEPGGSIEATKEAIEKLWDAKLFDFYGISDIFGACAGMCEERDGLHLAEDQILLEVINPDTLEPVAEGERGEMVLTTLRKKGRPMIRFRTGDIITHTTETCKCGRTQTRINVVGRLDDMFIAAGVNVFPSDIEYIVRNTKGLTGEYRIIVFYEKHITKFKIEVEKLNESDLTEKELSDIVSQEVKSHLGVKPKSVEILKEGELPRATHKAKRLIDLREE